MRVLTVRQPWAWAIIHGGKDVENRARNIAGDYRGPVAIHAGLRVEEEDAAVWGFDGYRDAFSRASAHDRHQVDIRGGIFGVVDLVDVHSASVIGGCGRMRYDCPEHGTCREHCSRWAMGPTADGWFQHLVFANPRPLAAPIPLKGALGLRTLPADVESQIRAVLS